MKAVPLALVVLLAAAPGLADQRPFCLTVTGGLTISKYRDVTVTFTEFEQMKGTSLGIGAAWQIAHALEIEPEALYIEKGISYGESPIIDGLENIIGAKETLHVQHFLELPVLLGYQVLSSGRVHPVLEAGPFVAFELGERMKLTGGVETSWDDQEVKNTDYGVVLGAGLEVQTGPVRWLLDGRYDRGLADLGTFNGTKEIHSDAFVISTGVRY
jgi:hypothetical protein